MRRVAVVLAALGLLAACSTGLEPSDRASATPALVPGSFVRPASLAGEPCGLEATPKHVWILTCSGNLLRLPKSGGGGRSQHLGGEVLALDGLVRGRAGRLWALVSTQAGRAKKGRVVAVDLASGAVGPDVDAGASVPMSAAESGDGLWVAMLDGRLVEITEAGARVADNGPPLIWATADGSLLWTIEETGAATLRDADGTERSTTERFAPESIAATAAFGSLWAATPSRVVMLDATTGAARKLDVQGTTVNGIEPCGENVWLSQPDFGVRSLTPAGTEATAVRLDVAPRYLACDGPRLWVLAEDGRLGSILITT